MYNDKIEIESPYGHITISYGRHDKHRVRVLDIDGGMESVTYIEEELQNELLFEYMYLFDLMFDENYLEDRQINDVLLNKNTMDHIWILEKEYENFLRIK